ncbi:hypothetical protein [Paludibaculum fermentans]|uniref:Uncharacterized protein n=1 Tax=Paludibaculum fermentans TaxID=1473598 RepID=A0A7S7NS15_PALFE|nr:hypothetical protein [Paludibaculum fermentans]QOY88772.1 hypothetical protein IRI77_02065 [Paludibaculum fermentans]
MCTLMVVSLAAVACGQASTDGTEASRFDPPFRNDVHAARPEDAGIVQIVGRQGNKAAVEAEVSLVHGHFFGGGRDAVVAMQFLPVPNGYSPANYVFSRGSGGWALRFRNDLLNAAYCRLIPTSAKKDILLCQTNFVGVEGVVDTNLYTLDFTRTPPDSEFFLQLRDTVGRGAGCLTWASLKSADYQEGTLHLVVEYGRNRLPAAGKLQGEPRNRAVQPEERPAGFPRQLYDLEFRLGSEGFALAGRSEKNFRYVTEPWDAGPDNGCSLKP